MNDVAYFSGGVISSLSVHEQPTYLSGWENATLVQFTLSFMEMIVGKSIFAIVLSAKDSFYALHSKQGIW